METKFTKQSSLPETLPSVIKDRIVGLPYECNTIGMSDSTVYMFDDFVLKIQKRNTETDNEVRIAQWLSGTKIVPEQLAYEIENDTCFTLMERIRGNMLCDMKFLKDTETLYKLLADQLHTLWQVDISTCPTRVSRLENRLKRARYLVEHDLVDVDNVEPETFGENGFRDPMDLLTWLEEHRPEEDIVLTHGDFCLPNLFFDPQGRGRLIDIGKMGPADRWQDIAICMRSVKSNLSGRYTDGIQVSEFSAEKLLAEIGVEWNAEKFRYYLLLDELF